jgi:TolB-like protein/class 3 adenylate cyclase/Tfp pilus assembly protein PilF
MTHDGSGTGDERDRRDRRLSVVMFIDMVGYTGIVAADETRAAEARATLRTLLGDLLQARGGTLVQSFGDGSLIVFSSAVAAAQTASDVQARFTDETGVELRIGLHLGEIAWDEEGVYGDAVNVAARLQAIATPGSALVSEAVALQLRSRREVTVVEVGSVRLKNVDEPVRVFALASGRLRTPGLAEIARRALEAGGGGSSEEDRLPRSLAVLPLANLSIEPGQEYFVAGMHEALLTELARIRALKVISRTSVLQYQDTKEPLSRIAEALGVEALIEGSVLRAGDRVRITTQLIALEPERHLWAESYDGDLSDVLDLHRSVASSVAAAVKSTLRPGEAQRMRKRQQVDPDAYEAYLRGRYAGGNVSNAKSLTDSVISFELAAQIDPGFPQPWVGIARSLAYLALFNHLDRQTAMRRSAEAVAHALTLDAEMGEALATRGYLSLIFNADAHAAVRDLERAVLQEPNSVPTLIDYGIALNASGRYAQSADAFDRAAERDPLSPTTAMMRGWGRFMGWRFEEARQILEQGTRVWPDFSYNHLWLAAARVMLGRVAEAGIAAERAVQLEGESEDHNFRCVIGWVWANLGRPDETRRLREIMMRQLRGGAPADPVFLVVMDGVLGDDDSAFQHLKEAIDSRSPILFHMPAHPFVDRLRQDPRFARLLSGAGLSPLPTPAQSMGI